MISGRAQAFNWQSLSNGTTMHHQARFPVSSDIWFDLGGGKSSPSCIKPEAPKMMSVSFPAGGDLYCVQDLERGAGKLDILLKAERFCIGPDVRLPLWYGRRSL